MIFQRVSDWWDSAIARILLVSPERQSRKLIGAIDRSRLGSFAVPLDALIAGETRERILEDTPDYGRYFEAMHHESIARLDKTLVDSGTDEDSVRVEVLFWWGIYDKSLLRYSGRALRRDTENAVLRLVDIYENPDMHDYFAAGIWDIPFIERCMSDGIDHEIAGSIPSMNNEYSVPAVIISTADDIASASISEHEAMERRQSEVLAEIEVISQKFIDGLDRTSMGDSAVPLDVLLAMDTAHRILDYITSDGSVNINDGYVDTDNRATAACSAAGVPKKRARAELMFWWAMSDPSLYKERSAKAAYYWNAVKAVAVTVYPDMEMYFDIGLQDMGYIRRCIDEGIDAELAVSLL